MEVRRAAASAPLAWLRERGMGASILVAAISSAFGVLLISATGYIAAMLRADPYIGDSEMLAFVLSFMTVLLVGVAVYVAAIVTANTFSTVIAGRTRRIALLRLIGASARTQRAEVARQGLVVGVIGAFLGLVAGTAVAAAGVWLAGRMLELGEIDFTLVQPLLLIPAVDRRAHHLGGSVGGIAPRARGDASAGTGRFGRGLPRPGRPHARGATSGRSRSSSRAGRCWLPAWRSGFCRRSAWSWPSSAASCRSPDSRSAPRWSCHRCCGSSAVCSVARRLRDWRPRTRFATRSARRAWRSES